MSHAQRRKETMANITITIPDEVLPRVQNAGITKQWVLDKVKEAVIDYETAQAEQTARQAVETAEANAQASVETAKASAEAEITLS